MTDIQKRFLKFFRTRPSGERRNLIEQVATTMVGYVACGSFEREGKT